MKRSILLAAFAALCCLCSDANAASLFGKVIDVSSGDVITIFNLNRPVRVKLLAVDAPELNQAFGDVAKKHLSDLVRDKSVLVEYSGIAPDRSVAGKVLLDNADIGAQMIRDGVAWFDPNNSDRLSAADREIYQQSEQAARSERRGLWQAENPTAPWEFVKAESRKKKPATYVATQNSGLAPSKRSGDSRTPELTNLTLMMSGITPAKHYANKSEIQEAWASLTASAKKWHHMRPEGQNFSAYVPDEGRQITYPVPFGDQTADLNLYIARDGASVYAVFWVTAPALGETDRVAIDGTVLNGFIKASHKSYERGDRGEFTCAWKREKNISTNGYTGIEFDMSSCTLPTLARAFTRVVDDQRQMVFAVVFYGDQDANVPRFMKSFTVGPEQKTKTRKR